MVNKALLKNCKIIGDNSISDLTDILIDDGRIVDIGYFDCMDSCEYHDLNGNYVSAGFIDIHTHGGNGSDFMDSTEAAFDNVLRYHLKHGVTGVLATSLTASYDDICSFLKTAREYMNTTHKYSQLLGVHLEGPFLSLKGCGAQNKKYLMNPQTDSYEFIIENRDIVKNVTIAPELDTDGKMTKALTENGILVSGGHDDGAYPEFIPAIQNGLRHLTHIYCAMSGIGTKEGVREIGLREYGLLSDLLTCEMIADNVHITPEMMRFILKCKRADNVAVVSDTLRCAGMPRDGRLYPMGPEKDKTSLMVKVSDGIAVLADGSKFAGSITSVHQMVKNLINAGVPIVEAFKTATSVPARIIREKYMGSVKKGFIANLCVLDENFDVLSVYVQGKKIDLQKGDIYEK